MLAKRRFTTIFTTVRKARMYNLFAEHALQQYLHHSYRYFVPCFSSFRYNMYRGSGAHLYYYPTISFVLFVSYKVVCRQRELPLLFDAAAVKCGSFLFFWGEGECDRGYLYLRSRNRGFKG